MSGLAVRRLCLAGTAGSGGVRGTAAARGASVSRAQRSTIAREDARERAYGDALQTRDRYEHRLWNGPGSAVHRSLIAHAAPRPGHDTRDIGEQSDAVLRT